MMIVLLMFVVLLILLVDETQNCGQYKLIIITIINYYYRRKLLSKLEIVFFPTKPSEPELNAVWQPDSCWRPASLLNNCLHVVGHYTSWFHTASVNETLSALHSLFHLISFE